MRKLKVQHQALPGIGELFAIPTGSGLTVTVVAHRSGRRDVNLGAPGADEPLLTLSLTRTEAVALGTLLTGAHIELIPAPLT